MTTFRCPKCKEEIMSTIYIKIKSARCTKCKKEMLKLYIPTVSIYKAEHEINEKERLKWEGLYSPYYY